MLGGNRVLLNIIMKYELSELLFVNVHTDTELMYGLFSEGPALIYSGRHFMPMRFYFD